MGKLLLFLTGIVNREELTPTVPHEGIRVGEIIAYRAWRVVERTWFHKIDDRLHSVYVEDYVWHPDEPASGDIREHGIYSFRHVIRNNKDYGCGANVPLLFGKVKIWGEIVEHELGYRSEFAKIISLDYGNQQLLDKFRNIYQINQLRASVPRRGTEE
jgi:hypothetical protein